MRDKQKSTRLLYLLIGTLLIFSLITIGTIVLKSNNNNSPCIPETPERIGQVPVSARWIGGCDGGLWYNIIEESPKEKKYLIGIYFDYNGELIIEKEFYLKSNCSFKNKEQLYNSIIDYDFFTIKTKNIDCSLYPVDNKRE